MSNEASFDPSDRQLCDDGACLGVIVDGKCNVCGSASASGSPRESGSGGGSGVAEGSPRDPGSGGSGGGGSSAMMASADTETFDPDRQLCPDGACTGVVGSDGKCKECGRSAAS
jgi:hypothetical protein